VQLGLHVCKTVVDRPCAKAATRHQLINTAVRPIDPVFSADSVVLAILAEKDGKLRLVYAGWDDTKVV
jgi:hypothetical protein